MSSRWVPLMQGTIPEVLTLQASCEASGIPTFVPDMNLLQGDPTIRGGDVFGLQLQVPEDRYEDAVQLMPVVAPVRDTLEKLGSRVRWCVAMVLAAPFGIWLGLRYLRATRGLERKPADHAWTVASFWACVGMTIVGAVVYGSMVLRR